MSNDYFQSLVKKYLHYLIDEFGYSVFAKLSDIDPSYGLIEFRSPQTIIRVVRQEDRPTDVFYIVIKPYGAPDDIGMSLKNILDALGAKSAFQDDHVSPQYLEDVMQKYAQELRAYCLEFIKGDFSRWNFILRYYMKEMGNWYESVLGEEIPASGRYREIENYIRANDAQVKHKR